jgi:hypothetical protein
MKMLARRAVTLTAVGKAVLQHQVLPLLEQRRRRVPVQRKQKHEHVVLTQALLLAVDIDTVIRVLGVQINQRALRVFPRAATQAGC